MQTKRRAAYSQNQGLQPRTQLWTWQGAPRIVPSHAQYFVPAISHIIGIGG